LVVGIALAGCGQGPQVERNATIIQEVPGSCAEGPLPIAAASASGQENNQLRPSFAIDGNAGTRWSSGRASTAWLVLDMGKREMVRRLLINWERAWSPLFWIQASDNAVNWATIGIVGATQPGPQNLSGIDTTARYFRILSQRASSFGNISIFEITAFGDPSTACLDVPSSCGATVLLPPSRARASSQEFSYTPASAAIDGVYSTRWSSKYSDNEWLAIDLGSDARIDTVDITWEHAFARRFALQTGVTFDGPWTTVAEDDDGQFATTVTAVGATARYLRLLGLQRATQYGYSVWELEVLGTHQLTCPGGGKTP
jgi:beta-glucosidase